MKRTILSLMVSIGLVTPVIADDLMHVYQQAIASDPVVNRAKALRDQALEGVSVSRANLLPQLSASVGYNVATRDNTQFFPNDQGQLEVLVFPTDSDTRNVDLNLNWSIYDHTNWVGLDRAEKVAQQSDAQLAAAMQQLIVRVVNAYFDALRARDNLEFVRAEKRSIERQLEQTRQRFEVGLTAITDVHEAQANFDNTVAQEIQAENALELNLEALRLITGKYHSRLSGLNTESFSTSKPTPERVDDWLSLAEERNLELLANRLAVDIAKQDIEQARAGHYPTLQLLANKTRTRTNISNPNFDISLPWLDNRSVNVSLNVPIYQGSRVTALTEQARQQFVIASEDMELVHRQTIQSVRSSFNDVKASISTIRALEQAVISAQSALEATEAGFDVGTRTIVDVLASTRNLFDAKRNLASARYTFIQSVINLKRAAGTLTDNDLSQINRGLSPLPDVNEVTNG